MNPLQVLVPNLRAEVPLLATLDPDEQRVDGKEDQEAGKSGQPDQTAVELVWSHANTSSLAR